MSIPVDDCSPVRGASRAILIVDPDEPPPPPQLTAPPATTITLPRTARNRMYLAICPSLIATFNLLNGLRDLDATGK